MELVIADSENAPDLRLRDIVLLQVDRNMFCVWLWAEALKGLERGRVLYLFNLDSPYGSIPTNLGRLNWNWCCQGLAVFKMRPEVFDLHFGKALASSQFGDLDSHRNHLSSFGSGQTLLGALKSASAATDRNLLIEIVEMACRSGSFLRSVGTLEAYLSQIPIPNSVSETDSKQTETVANPQSPNVVTRVTMPPLRGPGQVGIQPGNRRKRAREFLILSGHDKGVRSVAWSPGGERLATGSDDGTAKVWDAATGEELISLGGEGHCLGSVAWCPDGTRLAVASSPHYTAQIWDAKAGKALLSLVDDDNHSECVAWSPDGKLLATGKMRGTKVWDAKIGKVVLSLRGEDGECKSIAWNPDGHRFATANFQSPHGVAEPDSLCYTAKIWNAETGEEFLSLYTRRKNRFVSVAWSPDGSSLATGTEHGTTQLWDAETGRSLLTLSDKDRVASVAWSPNGKFIATVCGVNTAAVWNARNGERLLTLRGHSRPVRSVAWSPRGERLATGSLDGTVRVWDIEIDS